MCIPLTEREPSSENVSVFAAFNFLNLVSGRLDRNERHQRGISMLTSRFNLGNVLHLLKLIFIHGQHQEVRSEDTLPHYGWQKKKKEKKTKNSLFDLYNKEHGQNFNMVVSEVRLMNRLLNL